MMPLDWVEPLLETLLKIRSVVHEMPASLVEPQYAVAP
jgi:hypothetical protein